MSEIKLMLMLCNLNDGIKSTEIDLLKIILNKYLNDEKYKSKKIKKPFLYFAKKILHNEKLKGKVFLI
jgi:hypothetical protein